MYNTNITLQRRKIRQVLAFGDRYRWLSDDNELGKNRQKN